MLLETATIISMYKGSKAVCGSTTKYRYGCRCILCKKASSEYWDKFRKKKYAEDPNYHKKQHERNKDNRNAQSKAYYLVHGEKTRKRDQDKRRLCLEHYSNSSVPYCKCCGEHTYVFLSIDHVDNGGTQHRKEIKGRIERFLIRNNFPTGYQILCHNCNMGKRINGGVCPHQSQN